MSMNGFRQKFVIAAGIAAFGEENVRNRTERALRFGEECGEAMQASGLTREQAHKLIDYAYDRPVGVLSQELAGTMLTAYGLADAHDIDLDEVTDQEIRRVIIKCRECAAKHTAKPSDMKAA